MTERWVCLDCGPDQTQFRTPAVHRLSVNVDEFGEWESDGEVWEVEHVGDTTCSEDDSHRVEWKEVTNLDRLKEAVDGGRGRGDSGGD
jgi:hypothetical protein